MSNTTHIEINYMHLQVTKVCQTKKQSELFPECFFVFMHFHHFMWKQNVSKKCRNIFCIANWPAMHSSALCYRLQKKVSCNSSCSQAILFICKALLLTVSGLFSDNISFWGNTSDVMQLVLLHIAWRDNDRNKHLRCKIWPKKATSSPKEWTIWGIHHANITCPVFLVAP